MSESMRRRTFLARTGALAGLAALAGHLGCDGGSAAGGVDAAGSSFVITNQDDSGHTHELTVLCADLAAGVAVTYSAIGPHGHTIMLSEEEITMIAAGQSVTVSFTDGHSHTFVIVQPDGVC
jgi:hypothetical protein